MPKKKRTEQAAGKNRGAGATASAEIRRALLEAALPDIAFDGWSAAVLDKACAKTGIAPGAAAEALPGGIADLALYFSEWADDKTLAALEKQNLAGMRVRDRIALGVRTRLEILAPWKQAVSATLAFLGFSARGAAVPAAVWRTADRLWWAAGDTATDYNHYTKRALLAGVLSATTLYWLNDDSEGHGDTWSFLDRRIDNVLTLGRALGRFGGIGERLRARRAGASKPGGKKRA